MVRIRLSRPLKKTACQGGFFVQGVLLPFSKAFALALGWRKKKLPAEVFSTTGEVLLFCKRAAAKLAKVTRQVTAAR